VVEAAMPAVTPAWYAIDPTRPSVTIPRISHRKPKPARFISTALLLSLDVVMQRSCDAIVEWM